MPNHRTQILEALKTKGMSKLKLSKLTGLSYFTVCNYLKGKIDSKDSTVCKMLETLEL